MPRGPAAGRAVGRGGAFLGEIRTRSTKLPDAGGTACAVALQADPRGAVGRPVRQY